MAEMTEAAWKRLLAMMRDGTVVPVVGSRLLVDADGSTSLLARVASKLLSDNDVDDNHRATPGLAQFTTHRHALHATGEN